ncbi:hypothetical protein, partial [Cellulomonas composti]|uniref:hypothetical protein n=1 Tax=Cellulomonas composti TaxID=266130 RepID=UPI00164987B5
AGGARRHWLEVGASRRDIPSLLASAYTVDDARDLAARLGTSVTSAASVLTGWLVAGCAPTSDEIARAAAVGGATRPVPSGAAIDSILSAVPRQRVDRVQAGLLLVALGARSPAVREIRSGVTTLHEYESTPTYRGGS